MGQTLTNDFWALHKTMNCTFPLRKTVVSQKKELKYFSIKLKKVTNLGKCYLLLKIHKCLFDVPEQPVISNCGTPTEKVSEFLDHVFKPVMQYSSLI